MPIADPAMNVGKAPGPGLINADKLRLFAPLSNYVALAPMLDREAGRCEINTPRRICHWLAHLYVESAGFTRLVENLNYSVEGLAATFPTRLSPADCQRLGRIDGKDASGRIINIRPADQIGIANAVYGGRFGNTQPGDGWRYRGRSWIQLSFHDNYAKATDWTGVDLINSPDLAARPDIACKIAADFWRVNGLNEIVDADPGETVVADIQASVLKNEEDDLEQGTRVVTGGRNGLDDRRRALLRASAIWRA